MKALELEADYFFSPFGAGTGAVSSLFPLLFESVPSDL